MPSRVRLSNNQLRLPKSPVTVTGLPLSRPLATCSDQPRSCASCCHCPSNNCFSSAWFSCQIPRPTSSGRKAPVNTISRQFGCHFRVFCFASVMVCYSVSGINQNKKQRLFYAQRPHHFSYACRCYQPLQWSFLSHQRRRQNQSGGEFSRGAGNAERTSADCYSAVSLARGPDVTPDPLNTNPSCLIRHIQIQTSPAKPHPQSANTRTSPQIQSGCLQ